MGIENILVCGAGQGGHAIAGNLAYKNYDVTLYTHTPKKLEEFKKLENKIKLTGIINADVKLKNIINNFESGINQYSKIILVTDANVHKYFAEEFAPILSNQEIIILSPGVGGALEFNNIVRKINPDSQIKVTETDTLMYACKVPKTGHSYIKIEKDEMLYVSIQENNKISNEKSFIEKIYPQFINTKNPLMSLDDSPVFHIVTMIKNANKILNEENFNFYIDGITREYANIMEEMDNERCSVAKRVGIKPRTVKEWLNQAYKVKFDSLYNMIQNTPPYQNTAEIPNRSPAPKSLYHRYLTEEIPLRAVPTSNIGKILEIKTPIYDEMIREASKLTGIDFKRTSRTLKDMNINLDYINSLKKY